MFTNCNVTNIINGIRLDTFQNKSDWCVIVHYFECFLKEKYKRKYTVDAYLKDVKQYIDWYFLINMDRCCIFNKKNLNKYELYLRNVKIYKENTITYKKVALRKVNKFLIEFNHHKSNEKFSNRTKRSQYNYLTESYVKL